LHSIGVIQLNYLFFFQGAIHHHYFSADAITSGVLLFLIGYLLWSINIRIKKEQSDEDLSITNEYNTRIENQKKHYIKNFGGFIQRLIDEHQPNENHSNESTSDNDFEIQFNNTFPLNYNLKEEVNDKHFAETLFRFIYYSRERPLSSDLKQKLILSINEAIPFIDKKIEFPDEYPTSVHILRALEKALTEIKNLETKKQYHHKILKDSHFLEYKFPLTIGYISLIFLIGKHPFIYLNDLIF
jgi:hypothetical protein